EMSSTKNRIAIFGTPAASFQFMPNSAEFSISTTPPGYRLFHLFADGGFRSECHYLPISMEHLDRNAHGY
ncbi:MAG: phosphodiesterase, partial [Methylomonas sp.]|nr:phosphodiesterase [Methylomonas sp.]